MAPLTIPFNDVHIQFQDLEYVHFWFDPDNHDSQNYLLEQIVDEETLKDPGSNSIAYFMASDKNTLKIAKGSSVLTDPILISTDGDEAYATILSIPLSILDSRPYEAISYDIEKQEIHLAPIAGNTYQNFTLPRKIIDMAQIIVSEEEITQEITQKIVPQKHVAVDEKKSWFRLAHGPHALLPVSVEPDKTIYLGPENEGSSDDFTENITDFKFPFILFTHPRTLAFQGYLNDSNAEKSINAKAFGNESVIEIDLAQTDMIVEPNALIGWTGDPYIGRQMFKDPRLVILGENYFYHYFSGEDKLYLSSSVSDEGIYEILPGKSKNINPGALIALSPNLVRKPKMIGRRAYEIISCPNTSTNPGYLIADEDIDIQVGPAIMRTYVQNPLIAFASASILTGLLAKPDTILPYLGASGLAALTGMGLNSFMNGDRKTSELLLSIRNGALPFIIPTAAKYAMLASQGMELFK